jgi:AcrR family transcriptional regulator
MLHASFRRIAATQAHLHARAPRHTAGDPSAAERILRAAEESFRESTYAGVSLRKIARRAGVSKSLVLYHYESKERIFAELQLRAYRRLAATLTQAAGAAASPAERARLALDALLASVRDSNDIAVHAMLTTRALWDAEAAPHVRAMRRELRDLLRATMQQIFAEDAKRLPVPIEATADVLWAALTGIGMEAAIGGSPADLDGAFEGLRAFAALAFTTPGGAASGGGPA